MVVALLLAGCANTAAPGDDEDTLGKDKVEVDETTGAIRGVVVDQTISPVPDAKVVVKGGGSEWSGTSDAEGLFIFNKMDPGTYFITVSKALFNEAQSSVEVAAGVASPLVRVQIDALFDTDPYLTKEKFSGYFQCAYSLGVSSTCVNDYTRICGNVDPSCCPGGCAPELASAVDNREYTTALQANWATINIEMTWDPSLAGTASSMGLTVSYKARVGASHNWGSFSGDDPMVARIDATERGGSLDDFPGKIPFSGLEDLFVFMSAGSGNVALSQNFEVFHTTSYIAPLPAGWSLIRGDPEPF